MWDNILTILLERARAGVEVRVMYDDMGCLFTLPKDYAAQLEEEEAVSTFNTVEDGSFEESGHYSECGSLDVYEILKAYHDVGFKGYLRPDHGRMIWGETGKPGYGLFDRALGAVYINGLFEACEKNKKIRR